MYAIVFRVSPDTRYIDIIDAESGGGGAPEPAGADGGAEAMAEEAA